MVSPGPSSSGLSSLNSSPIKFPDTTTPLANPPKRPKTSPMTKEAMQRDKEAKHRIIEEKRAERAERDRLRAEEKARKEEIRQVKLFEKEEKRKAREEENKVREEEKRLKEEEKAKKERVRCRAALEAETVVNVVPVPIEAQRVLCQAVNSSRHIRRVTNSRGNKSLGEST